MRAARLHAVWARAQHLLGRRRSRACAGGASGAARRARRAASRRRRPSCRRCARRPRASWVRSTMSASSGAICMRFMAASAAHRAQASAYSCRCGLLRAEQACAHQFDFAVVLLVREAAAHQFEAQVDQVGVDDVGLAVVADVRRCGLRGARPRRPRPSCRACRGSPAAAPSCRGRRARGPGSPTSTSIRSTCRQ